MRYETAAAFRMALEERLRRSGGGNAGSHSRAANGIRPKASGLWSEAG